MADDDRPPPRSAYLIERKADLQNRLILSDLAAFELPPHLNNFKPANVPKRLARALKGFVDCRFNPGIGCADQFDDLVDVVFHDLLPRMATSCRPQSEPRRQTRSIKPLNRQTVPQPGSFY